MRSAATVIADDENDGATPEDTVDVADTTSSKANKKTAGKAPSNAKRARTSNPSPSDEWMDVDDLPPRVEKAKSGNTKAPKSNILRKGTVDTGYIQRYNMDDSYLETPADSAEFMVEAPDPARKRTYHSVFDDVTNDDIDQDDDFIPQASSRSGLPLQKTKPLVTKPKPIMIEDSDDDITVEGYGVTAVPVVSSSVVVESNGANPSAAENGKILSRAQKKLFARWLEEYRKRWASYWNYMDNTVVNAIVNTVPQTKDELSQLPKFGQSKAEMWGEHILATIWSFLNTHYLLEHFPILNANPPKLPDCPTWRDPLSTEAEAVRAANSTSSIAKVKPLAQIEDSCAMSSTLLLAQSSSNSNAAGVVGGLLDELQASEDPRSWAWDSAAEAPPLIQSPPRAYATGLKNRENVPTFAADSFAVPSVGSMKNIYSSFDNRRDQPSATAYQHYSLSKGNNAPVSSPPVAAKTVSSFSPLVVPPPNSLPHSPYY